MIEDPVKQESFKMATQFATLYPDTTKSFPQGSNKTAEAKIALFNNVTIEYHRKKQTDSKKKPQTKKAITEQLQREQDNV